MKSQRIGFLGTGIMGFQMARNLCEAGYPLSAWNRTREKAVGLAAKGALIAEFPQRAAEGADMVIVMLSDGPTCDQVLIHGDGESVAVLDCMAPEATLIVMSSIPMETAQEHAQAAQARSVKYLDAPVSGGEKGATEGRLVIMVGGESSIYEECKSLFEILGRPTLVGPTGCGQLAKLANQLIVANTINTVAEALLLARQGGADPAAVRAALLGGFADSEILKQHGERISQANWRPGAPAKHQLKDCQTALTLAEKLNLDLPLSKLALEMFTSMIDQGNGELDHSAVYLEVLRRNHLN